MRRFSRRALWFIAGNVGLGLSIAAVLSLSYWGYAFRRPAIDGRVRSAKDVGGRSSLVGVASAKGCDLRYGPAAPADEAIRFGESDPYYGIEARFLKPLAALNKNLDQLGLVSVLGASELAPLLQAAFSGGSKEPGTKCPSGEVLQLVGADGAQLVFVSASTTPDDPDHRTVVEALFGQRQGRWESLSVRRFFFDIAGIEGLEWPWLHALVIACCMCVSAIGVGIFGIARLFARLLVGRPKEASRTS
jgi:hypothetical protein